MPISNAYFKSENLFGGKTTTGIVIHCLISETADEISISVLKTEKQINSCKMPVNGIPEEYRGPETEEVNSVDGTDECKETDNLDSIEENYGSSNVQISQQIDALDSVQRWSEAEVLKIDKEKKQVYITYLYWEDKWDEWIRDSEGRMAPLHTHTYFRGGPLKKGQRIECKDTLNNWIESIIIDESEAKILVHYHCWSAQYDEWISRTEDIHRIRPYGRSKDVVNRKKSRVWRVPGTTTASPSSPNAAGEENRTRQIKAFTDRYNHYISTLRSHGLEIVAIPGDGNCLFRSISHQVYGDDSYHDIVREKCLDYMEVDAGFFSQFVEGGMQSFARYVAAKRRNAVWGDDPEIQALCELYDRPAEIWAYDSQLGARKLRTFHDSNGRVGREPMRLSYYGGGHYDSVVSTDHASHLLRSSPGLAEDHCVRRLRERLQMSLPDELRDDVSFGFEGGEMKDAERVAAEATEQAALELAVRRSRSELDAWGCEDLQSALAMSFADMDQTMDKVASTTTATTVTTVSNVVGGTDSHSESVPMICAPAETGTGTMVGSGNRIGTGEPPVDAELMAIQGQLLRDVAEQSEREFLEKAMQDSLMSMSMSMSSHTGGNDPCAGVGAGVGGPIFTDADTEEELLRQASLLSMQETQGAAQVDEELALALELSRMDGHAGIPTSDSFPSIQEQQSAFLNADEESLLQAALEASLDESFVVVPPSGSYSDNFYLSEDDDAELRRAIEESLRGS
eukprot:gene10932-22823_t